MFFGATSSARSFGSFCLRSRFLSAIATARFALCCPPTCLSSSETIWRGVSASVEVCVRSGSWMGTLLEFLDHELVVRINANIGGDADGVLGDLARAARRAPREGPARGQRERPPGSDRDDAVVWLDEVAGAREQE